MKKLFLASMALLCSLIGRADNGFAIDDFTITANGEATVQIKMNNDVVFSGFQFDLELPEGVSIKKNAQNNYTVAATNRLKVYDDFEETWVPTHTVTVSLQASGAYRIMAYSSTSANIQGTSGTAVLRMQLQASDQVATGTFTPSIKNLVMSQADETQYKPADCSYNCTVTLNTTVTTLGYASFSWPKALDFTNSGLTAFIVTSCSNTSMHLEPVTKVPANTGLILKGIAGSDNIYPLETTDDETDDVSENMLTSNTTDTYTVETDNVYVLSNLDDGQPGFYLAAQGIHVGKYKSFLVLSENPNRLALAFEEDDVTGIGNLTPATQPSALNSQPIYTLDGRRIQNPGKGVYIVNGKLIIIK